MERECKRCGVSKPVERFRLLTKEDGRKVREWTCRDCRNADRREATRVMRLTTPKKKTGPKPVRFVVTEKRCARCDSVKPASAFSIHKTMRDGLNSHCKQCCCVIAREWDRAHPERKAATRKRARERMTPEQERERSIRATCARRGLTREQHDALFVKAGHACEICGSKKKLCVDHDHVTGDVRGIVCAFCNMGLHYLDKPGWELAAKQYLAKTCRPT